MTAVDQTAADQQDHQQDGLKMKSPNGGASAGLEAFPTFFREFAEKGSIQATENLEKMQTISKELASATEATFVKATEGAKDCHAKIFDIVQTNTGAVFELAGSLAKVKTAEEAFECSLAHARRQVETITAQNKDLLTLVQKVGAETTKPMTSGISKAFEMGV